MYAENHALVAWFRSGKKSSFSYHEPLVHKLEINKKRRTLNMGINEGSPSRGAASDCEINRSTYAVMHLQETWDMAANEKPPVNELNPIC